MQDLTISKLLIVNFVKIFMFLWLPVRSFENREDQNIPIMTIPHGTVLCAALFLSFHPRLCCLPFARATDRVRGRVLFNLEHLLSKGRNGLLE